MRRRIQVVLASDQAYFPGLACACLSILAATDTRDGITFHILDGGIEDTSWATLEKKVASANGEIRLQRRPLSFAELTGLPLDYGNGVMTYARLLMPSLIDEDEVIYVDADILSFCDLRALWDEPLEDNLVAACQDFSVKLLANDSLFDLDDDHATSWYFNAGFMKVNLKLWREENVQDKVLRLVRDYRSKCTWWDQTALNYYMKGRVKFLDRRWNRFSFENFSAPDFSAEKINIHYVSKAKPWIGNRSNKNISDVVWRLFRASQMPAMGRRKGWLESVNEKCYDAMLNLSSRWGGVGIAFIDLFRWMLRLVAWNPRLQEASIWLEKQRTKIEILTCVGNLWDQPVKWSTRR
jgi:lipopolysaccharide biosynthesis glycosyltransferase